MTPIRIVRAEYRRLGGIFSRSCTYTLTTQDGRVIYVEPKRYDRAVRGFIQRGTKEPNP